MPVMDTNPAFRTETRPYGKAAITDAARLIQAGHCLAVPTETVYGLAADALQPEAVAAVFKAKGRPANHPLIVHVASAAQVPVFASQVPDFAQRLMQAFWPGPLTLVLPLRADSGLSPLVTAGLDKTPKLDPSKVQIQIAPSTADDEEPVAPVFR